MQIPYSLPFSDLSPNEFLQLVSKAPFSVKTPPNEQGLVRLERYIAAKKEALAAAPDGKLLVSSARRGLASAEFYRRVGESREYLAKDKGELVRALAQKEYDAKQLQEAERLLAKLGRFTDQTLTFQECYGSLRSERQALVEPDFLPDDMVCELWDSIQYESLGFSANYPEYYLTNDQRVRSLAERKIGNRLLERDILFLYEFPLRMQDGGLVYPDFTCLNLRTRKLYRWEHLGRLDEHSYIEKNLRKLERYRQSGFQLCVDLIVSQDTGGNPLSEREIDQLIDNFLV